MSSSRPERKLTEQAQTMVPARVLAICILGIGAAQSAAAEYPFRTVRVLVGSSPGGGIDAAGRITAKKLTEVTGHSFVVENRPGAAGVVATELVARAAPDGYTLMMASSSHVVNPSLYARLPYDPVKDFTAVSLVMRSPNVLVVHPSVPARSVKDLIALARARPGALNFGSAGSGQASHLGGERFKLMAGVNITHVPYKGTGPAVIGLLGGELDLMFANLPSVLEHVKVSRLRALGIAQLKRSAAVPGLPTVAESGVPGFEAGAWYGLIGPAGLPPDVVNALYRAVLQGLDAADLKELLRVDGSEAVGSSPKEFAAFIPAEIRKWAAVVKNAGIKGE
jgi:tripartite-type tricarboxylate transporter receptor subunit TctC